MADGSTCFMKDPLSFIIQERHISRLFGVLVSRGYRNMEGRFIGVIDCLQTTKRKKVFVDVLNRSWTLDYPHMLNIMFQPLHSSGNTFY